MNTFFHMSSQLFSGRLIDARTDDPKSISKYNLVSKEGKSFRKLKKLKEYKKTQTEY